MIEETYKRWSPAEIKLLQELVEQGLSADEIFKNGTFPERTHKSITHAVSRLGLVGSHQKSSGSQVSEADIVGLESFVKRYVDAFNKLCDSTDYDKADLERFRLIHTYARDYPALLAEHERLKQVEEGIAEINRRLTALEAQAQAS
jgi:hypothetical protein